MVWTLGAVKNPKGCVTVCATGTTWDLSLSEKVSQLPRVNLVVWLQTMLKIIAHASIPNLHLVPRTDLIVRLWSRSASDQQDQKRYGKLVCHGVLGTAQRRGERWRRAPGARIWKKAPPAAIRSTKKLVGLIACDHVHEWYDNQRL
jgi:hypothetical protein